MARFEYAAYPEGIPDILARAWCHILQYFYNLDAAHGGDPHYRISPADVAAYEETAEFAEAVADLRGHVQGQHRIPQIRTILA